MTQAALGRLEKVDLRQVWLSEASQFTPWLAQEENLEILGNTIGLELELEAQEKNVGPFRADLLCRDTATGQWVLIENQLERTDHTHLGQLLTYAAGLEAVTVVWVAAEFTEEHRATLDWLNEITDDRFQFFGLEIELWRIGESPPAPKFNIVSKPNDWSRSVTQSARRLSGEALTATQLQQRRYWEAFGEFLIKRKSPIRAQKAQPQNWTTYGVGRTDFHLSAVITAREKCIYADLYIDGPDAKAYFHLLEQQKAVIESELGEPLDWLELPERKASRIILFRRTADPEDESDWPAQHAWLAQALERLDRVFRPRVKALNAADWREPALPESA